MNYVGYAYLCDTLKLKAFSPKFPAMIGPMTRLERMSDRLAVPANMAPKDGDVLGHLFFALKHEGINLPILFQTLENTSRSVMESAIAAAPNGIYVRKACFLWEASNHQELDLPFRLRGTVVPLFDPTRYITGPSIRNAKWRIDFNGLGTLAYCATVERTAEIEALLAFDTLGRIQQFVASLPPSIMDRAINWAYLSETADSFAIEREAPTEDKSRRFMQLLRQAHERQPLTEEYLVTLQNSTINNPFDLAAAFRHEQNHLHNGLRGAAGVTYVPPPAPLCEELMQALMSFANDAPSRMDPLVAASVISFGFVLLHPFMDGNGRLSRFLIHQALCRAGALDNGLLLPVSVAMKRDEAGYLDALQSFSKPAREFWDVRWIDGEDLSFDFTGHPSLYRYWDATACVAFGLEMAKRALEVVLKDETEFLERYDYIVRTVNERYDLRGNDLSNLVMMCLENQGVVSKNRRRQYTLRVPEVVFDYIEILAQQCLATAQTSPTQT
jgi:hypothetical protein